jgi:hypothetical protein
MGTSEDKAGREDYEVGYGRPPLHTRFKKGQSGNPKGRRRKRKDADMTMSELMREVLREPIVVTVAGRKVKMSKGKAYVETLINRALTGDGRAASTVFQALKHHGEFSPRAAEGGSGVLVIPGENLTDQEWEEKYGFYASGAAWTPERVAATEAELPSSWGKATKVDAAAEGDSPSPKGAITRG